MGKSQFTLFTITTLYLSGCVTVMKSQRQVNFTKAHLANSSDDSKAWGQHQTDSAEDLARDSMWGRQSSQSKKPEWPGSLPGSLLP